MHKIIPVSVEEKDRSFAGPMWMQKYLDESESDNIKQRVILLATAFD